MRRKGFTALEAIVVAAIIAILAAILLPTFQRTHCNARREDCQGNLKRIGLAFLQYVQDYDNRFPLASKNQNANWADSLQPYVGSLQIFKCPSAEGKAFKRIDYFFNSRLAQTRIYKVRIRQTILSGDGQKNSPPFYSLAELPSWWRESDKFPATRHVDGANYLFVDGHVKWLLPEKVADGPQLDDGQIATFAR